MTRVLMVDGHWRQVVYEAHEGAARALVDYDGVIVAVDRRLDDGTWELSGVPVRAGTAEGDALKALLEPTLNKTIVNVVPPEAS